MWIRSNAARRGGLQMAMSGVLHVQGVGYRVSGPSVAAGPAGELAGVPGVCPLSKSFLPKGNVDG